MLCWASFKWCIVVYRTITLPWSIDQDSWKWLGEILVHELGGRTRCRRLFVCPANGYRSVFKATTSSGYLLTVPVVGASIPTPPPHSPPLSKGSAAKRYLVIPSCVGMCLFFFQHTAIPLHSFISDCSLGSALLFVDSVRHPVTTMDLKDRRSPPCSGLAVRWSLYLPSCAPFYQRVSQQSPCRAH